MITAASALWSDARWNRCILVPDLDVSQPCHLPPPNASLTLCIAVRYILQVKENPASLVSEYVSQMGNLCTLLLKLVLDQPLPFSILLHLFAMSPNVFLESLMDLHFKHL